MWISIDKKFTKLDEDIYIGAVYIPPENSRFFNNDFWCEFENELSEKVSGHKYVYIAGDTNSRIGKLNDFIRSDPHINNIFDIDEEIQSQLDKYRIIENLSIPLNRSSRDCKTNTHGLRLVETLRNNNLFLLNGRMGQDRDIGAHTFRNKSVIDFVFATAECFSSISDFYIAETDTLFSDGHNALHWEILLPSKTAVPKINRIHGNISPKWQSDKSDVFKNNINVAAIHNLSAILDNQQITQSTIDDIASELQHIFQNAAEITFPNRPSIPKITSFANNKPWFGPKCKHARDNYHDAKEKYKNNPSADNKTRLRNASKSYKRVMNFYIKKQKQSNSDKLREMSGKNPKQYWKFLKSLKPKNKDNISPNVSKFYEHFKEINTNYITDERFTEEINVTHELNDYINSPISETEIKKCIANLRNAKSPSPIDKITNEYIKSTADILLPFYCKLFNSVFESGYIPQSWLEGTIIPIYKNKGDPQDPNNYRPITILSCLGKLFTSVLNDRLTKYLEDNEILHENQAGFRKGFSCSDHIFTLYSLIEIIRKKKLKLFSAFIDFSQAFDKVWRAGLWHKLLQNSINGKFFTLIQNMYRNIKSRISHNGNISNTFISEIGVRQGENLSPILFSMFLNDLQSYMHLNGCVGIELIDPINLTFWLKLLVLLYADDTVIVADSPEDLQTSLNIFHTYCSNWHLNVNVNKTKIIIFGARQLSRFNFKLGDQPIEITDKYHYLGVTLSSSGSFLKARKHAAEQASKAMHLLFTRVNNADIPIDLVIKLFDHTVLPVLTYGSEIYGFENLDMLEKVHNDFLRKITKSRRSTPINFLYGELGRYPISIVIKSRMIAFWNRLILGDEKKLSLQIYKYMVNLPNSNFKWLNEIKLILTNVGRLDLWENQFRISNKNIHKEIRQLLIDQFKQSWHSDLQTSNKGRIYCSFKENHEMEMYFKTLQEHDYLTLCNFRTANHKLPVETGRYDGTPFEDRICELCQSGSVACEHHYLIDCPFFQQERERYLDPLNIRHYDRTLKTLLSSTSQHVLQNLCKFIRVIMKKFRS